MRFQCIKLRHPAFIDKGAPALVGVLLLPLLAEDSRARAAAVRGRRSLTPSGRCQVETWARAYTPADSPPFLRALSPARKSASASAMASAISK